MSKACECSHPGYCPRYGRRVLGRDYELCSGRCPPERPCSPELSEGRRASWDALRAADKLVDPDRGRRPSAFARAWGFSVGIARWAWGGFRVAGSPVARRRLAICRQCPHYDAAGGTCRLCTCKMQVKVLLATSQCPDDPPRWKALGTVE